MIRYQWKSIECTENNMVSLYLDLFFQSWLDILSIIEKRTSATHSRPGHLSPTLLLYAHQTRRVLAVVQAMDRLHTRVEAEIFETDVGARRQAPRESRHLTEIWCYSAEIDNCDRMGQDMVYFYFTVDTFRSHVCVHLWSSSREL